MTFASTGPTGLTSPTPRQRTLKGRSKDGKGTPKEHSKDAKDAKGTTPSNNPFLPSRGQTKSSQVKVWSNHQSNQKTQQSTLVKPGQTKKIGGPKLRITTSLAFCAIGLFLTSCANPRNPATPPHSPCDFDVQSFGAKADAIQLIATTFAGTNYVRLNSPPAAAPTSGAVIELFGAGTATSHGCHEDLIARIEKVSESTNLWISTSPTVSSQTDCTIGTDNAHAFQAAVRAAQGQTNTAVYVPPGKYLLMPTGIGSRANTVSAAVTITASVRFRADDPERTILLGNGAWQLCGRDRPTCQRGTLFAIQGPMRAAHESAIFENLSFDGGVRHGLLTTNGAAGFTADGFPGSIIDGWGWDWTHGSHLDCGQAPLPALQVFQNCQFRHWRGEILKSVTSRNDGLIVVNRCKFEDSNASGFNFTFTHRIEDCRFDRLRMAMEFYEGYSQGTSRFIRNTCTNLPHAISLVGALTENSVSAYEILSNRFDMPDGSLCIQASPVKNLTMAGNEIHGGLGAFWVTSAGYQGTDCNRNLLIEANTFIGNYRPLALNGSGDNRSVDVLIASNRAEACNLFLCGYGWSSNVLVRANIANAAISSVEQSGQWFTDDGSNRWPPHPVSFTDPHHRTNTLSYANGSRQQILSSLEQEVVCIVDASIPKIPVGARLQLVIKTERSGGVSLASQGKPIANDLRNTELELQWDGKGWSKN